MNVPKKVLAQVNAIEPFLGMYNFALDMGKTILALKDVPGNILEIGTRRGKTSIYFAKLLKEIKSNKKVITIDPFFEGEEIHLNKFKKNLTHFKLDNLTHLRLTSDIAFGRFAKRVFCFIFLDGDHTRAAVEKDVRSYIRLLSEPKGLMAVDDVKNTKWPGVRLAIESLKKQDLISHVRSCGRGVYIKRHITVSNPVAAKQTTICEKHREIYDLVQGLGSIQDSERSILLDRLSEAFDMGKRMNRKLRKYAKNYDEGMWEPNEDWEEDLFSRLKRMGKL